MQSMFRFVKAPFFVWCLVALSLVSQKVSALADDPMIARYANTELDRSIEEEYVKYPIATSPVSEDGKLSKRENGGSLAHRLYRGGEKDSIDLAFESLSAALTKNGLSVIFECNNESCGGDLVYALFGSASLSSNYSEVQQSGLVYNDFYYLAAEKVEAGRRINVIYFLYKYQGNELYIAQDIFKPKEIVLKDVVVDINFNTLPTTGSVVLDGVYFDTDSSRLKKKSADSLNRLAKFLKSKSNDRFYIVGHTDGQGAFEYNMKLSKDRANAVVRSLVQNYRISKDQLIAKGVGPLSPNATNQNESGRVLNRRVELVLSE